AIAITTIVSISAAHGQESWHVKTTIAPRPSQQDEEFWREKSKSQLLKTWPEHTKKWPEPFRPTTPRSLEEITGIPKSFVTPLPGSDDEAGQKGLATLEAALPPLLPGGKTIIGNDYGGQLYIFIARYAEIKKRGDAIEIYGSCESACTLVMNI